MCLFMLCSATKSFQLVRINPSGGVHTLVRLRLASMNNCFQLVRINPSGGAMLLRFPLMMIPSFQLFRINPSGGGVKMKMTYL